MFLSGAEMTSLEALSNALYMAIKAPTSDASAKLVAMQRCFLSAWPTLISSMRRKSLKQKLRQKTHLN
jgi:hypothetical protein